MRKVMVSFIKALIVFIKLALQRNLFQYEKYSYIRN